MRQVTPRRGLCLTHVPVLLACKKIQDRVNSARQFDEAFRALDRIRMKKCSGLNKPRTLLLCVSYAEVAIQRGLAVESNSSPQEIVQQSSTPTETTPKSQHSKKVSEAKTKKKR